MTYLIKERLVEDEEVEFKKNLNDTFVKEVVAFLNTRDGIVYIGIEDNGNVCGVTRLDEMMKEISDIVTLQILPSAQDLINIRSIFLDGKVVIEVKVKKGNKLYYIKKYGRSEKGCYVRIGTTCRSLCEEQIVKRLLEEVVKDKVNIINVECHDQTPSFSMLKNCYIEKGYHINDINFEKNYCLKNMVGKYNLLSNLLKDENDVSIKIIRFSGDTKSELIEKSEYGYVCLLFAIDKVLARFDVINLTLSELDGSAQRKDKRLVNSKCLREAFLNAIAHNDWVSKVSPSVYVFNDRIEIVSSGGLPDGLSLDEFYSGYSKPRNPELMRILRDLEYVEQSGYGINKIIEIYGKDVFEITDNFIKVVLPFDKDFINEVVKGKTLEMTPKDTEMTPKDTKMTPKDTKMTPKDTKMTPNYLKINDIEKSILKGILDDRYITIDVLAKEMNVSESTIKRNIKMLKDKKILVRVGSNRSGFWEVNYKNRFNKY